MAISLQADASLPQGYIQVNGTTAATVKTTGISGIDTGAVGTSQIANNAVTAAKLGTNEQRQICKAWVNFNGTFAVVSGLAYSRSGTTVTVTWTSHGQSTGFGILVQSATDTGLVSTNYYTITVINANTITFQTTSTGAASGTLSVVGNMIRSSYNVSSITKLGAGLYSVNYANSLPDSNYAVVTGFQTIGTAPSNYVNVVSVNSQSTSSVNLGTAGFGWNSGADTPFVYLAIFGN